MVELGGRWQHEQEHDINRLAVDGIEFDGVLQANQKSKGLFDFTEARMRDRDAAANPRGAKFIAFFDLARYVVGR